MATGNYQRKVRTALCSHCQESFKTTSTNAEFCPDKPECQREKKRRWNEERKHKKKAPVLKAEKTGRRCRFVIGRGEGKDIPCGKSTGKNWFFCKQHFSQVEDMTDAYGCVSL